VALLALAHGHARAVPEAARHLRLLYEQSQHTEGKRLLDSFVLKPSNSTTDAVCDGGNTRRASDIFQGEQERK
jgi:hypothetical protein